MGRDCNLGPFGAKWACCESEQPVEQRGVSIKFLAPKGKYFNPLELLFNDLKQHDIRPNFPKNGRLLSKSKIAGLIRGCVDETAARVVPGFFQARANGKDAVAKKHRLIVLFVQQCANQLFNPP